MCILEQKEFHFQVPSGWGSVAFVAVGPHCASITLYAQLAIEFQVRSYGLLMFRKPSKTIPHHSALLTSLLWRIVALCGTLFSVPPGRVTLLTASCCRTAYTRHSWWQLGENPLVLRKTKEPGLGAVAMAHHTVGLKPIHQTFSSLQVIGKAKLSRFRLLNLSRRFPPSCHKDTHVSWSCLRHGFALTKVQNAFYCLSGSSSSVDSFSDASHKLGS